MTGALLALALAAAYPCPNPTRSEAAVEAFKRANPPPKRCATYVRRGARFVLYDAAGACQVDHVCPLACCGPDVPANMQWLDAAANRAKGADCSSCEVRP